MTSGIPPTSGSWNYDPGELFADRIVHAIGLSLGVLGAPIILLLAASLSSPAVIASTVIYAAGLLAMLSFSAAYNLWPVSQTKWILRRFDHAAIYVMIAGTYTPFLVQMKGNVSSDLLIAVWVTAVAGVALKLLLIDRFEGIAVAVYLVLGWSGLLIYQTVAATIPELSILLLGAGGALYTGGLLFYGWQSLRFQNVVWHAFVLVAACCHYFAILDFIS